MTRTSLPCTSIVCSLSIPSPSIQSSRPQPASSEPSHSSSRPPPTAQPRLKPGSVALRVLVLLPHNLVVQRDALSFAAPHAVAEGTARKAARSGSGSKSGAVSGAAVLLLPRWQLAVCMTRGLLLACNAINSASLPRSSTVQAHCLPHSRRMKAHSVHFESLTSPIHPHPPTCPQTRPPASAPPCPWRRTRGAWRGRTAPPRPAGIGELCLSSFASSDSAPRTLLHF